jgi:hypothetical protein
MLVVDKDDTVTDKDFVVDLDAGADERMTGDLATLADCGAALNLDERAYSCVVADGTTVKVRKRLNHNAFPEPDLIE